MVQPDDATRRDLNAFLMVSVVAGSFLMFLVTFMIPEILRPAVELSAPVRFALGFPFLMGSLFPALRARARHARPPAFLSWRRYLIGSLLGALTGAVVLALVRPWNG
jgi:hypothetical protein